MLPNNFKPRATFNLVRLGKNNDGGYLVDKDSIYNSKSLVSMGIGKDWSFEKDFYAKKPVTINAYDHTIDIFFWIRFFIKKILRVFLGQFSAPYRGMLIFIDFNNFFTHKAQFFGKKIGSCQFSTTSIDQAMEKLSNNEHPVFFKLDIESSEYEVLDQLIDNAEYMTALVIEFHHVDKHQRQIEQFIDSFSLELVHIHPNNNRGNDSKGDPLTLEMTFAGRPQPISKEVILPNILDQVNVPRKDDTKLIFSPELA